MKLLLQLVFCLLVFNSLFGQSTGTIKYMAIKQVIPNIEFELPDLYNWNLVADSPPETGSMGMVMFKRKPILDSEGRPIEPVMAILYEYHSDTVDVVEYSIGFLGTKRFRPKWNLLGGFPDHSNDQHSAVFDAKYTRETVEHSLVLGYIKCNNYGIEITCDATTDVFPEVEAEMRKFVKSVKIVSKN